GRCISASDGGCIEAAFAGSEHLELYNTVLQQCEAGSEGGGVQMSGGRRLPVEASLVIDHTSPSSGGAFSTRDVESVEIERSTIWRNSAGVRGGAIDLAGSGTASMVNNTFLVNEASRG